MWIHWLRNHSQNLKSLICLLSMYPCEFFISDPGPKSSAVLQKQHGQNHQLLQVWTSYIPWWLMRQNQIYDQRQKSSVCTETIHVFRINSTNFVTLVVFESAFHHCQQSFETSIFYYRCTSIKVYKNTELRPGHTWASSVKRQTWFWKWYTACLCGFQLRWILYWRKK